ncbi:YitT family protein [Rossellomorea aquimaris]|uniref:YczE/YyaS/YitT family protein n=1 Tax=Rossellomorea aquimaris TaxID=189382 RepID=UPI001CD4D715|nr:YitT family protein [Rossellomorea aquimaris]MCA1055504.1 YitT family protein [Rossellomorea aquimaris]
MMMKRSIFFTIGLFILTLGVSLIIKSGLGASAWDALAVGQSRMFGITVGTAVFINGIVLIILNAIIMKKRPDILATLTIFVIGLLIDFWLLVVLADFAPQALINQFLAIGFGILTVGLGVSIYLQAKFPASPMDTLMVAIHTRFGLNLRNSRIISEGFALTLAFLFKGDIGIGTILVTLLLGFVVQYLFPIFEQLFERDTYSKAAVPTE